MPFAVSCLFVIIISRKSQPTHWIWNYKFCWKIFYCLKSSRKKNKEDMYFSIRHISFCDCSVNIGHKQSLCQTCTGCTSWSLFFSTRFTEDVGCMFLELCSAKACHVETLRSILKTVKKQKLKRSPVAETWNIDVLLWENRNVAWHCAGKKHSLFRTHAWMKEAQRVYWNRSFGMRADYWSVVFWKEKQKPCVIEDLYFTSWKEWTVVWTYRKTGLCQCSRCMQQCFLGGSLCCGFC